MTQNEKTQKMPICVFEQNCKKMEMEIFPFCVITCEPISFVKDEHSYFEKMARIGHNTVIYKGTFVFNQSLCS